MKQTIEIDVPDGYEFYKVKEHKASDPAGWMYVMLKPKQTKDFNYFVDQYLPSRDNSTSDEIIDWMDMDAVDRLNTYLKTKQFNLVPWEIKIGLFRFICNEIKVDMTCMTNNLKINADQSYTKLFPKEFIDDLFKTKTN